MGSAIPRLNGIPGFMKNENAPTRGAFATLALTSLIEIVKSTVKGIFASFVALICCGCNSKWNKRAIEEMKNTFTFLFVFPVCLAGIAAPRVIEKIMS